MPRDAAPRPEGVLVDSRCSGAVSLVRSLEAVGVTDVFGIPGGAILPAYDALNDSSIRHILVRHEQGAGHAAEGFAVASGKVGVCMATSGPGATNLVTPLADAYMDSVPIVAITGQVASSLVGTDAFQEADIRGITMPITKHNYLVDDPGQIPAAIAEAFHIASTGRPGPVLVDITKSALQAQTVFEWPETIELAGYRPPRQPNGRQLQDAAALIAQARRPVFYVGGGVIRARADAVLARMVELTGIPVVTTLMARGAFPDSHLLHLGMPGMHGSVAAVAALQKSDLIIALGTRFDNRVTGDLTSFAPLAKVIHADIDPAEIGKNRPVDVPIVGDCRSVISGLIVELVARIDAGDALDYEEWTTFVGGIKADYPVGYVTPEDGSLAPQFVLERLARMCGPETIFSSGVGQHQMWAAHHLPHERPNRWINSGGLGTMGFAVPAAMGAQVACPQSTVWAVDGDGCFQMTNQELATCAINKIPIKVAIINNQSLGMVRQLQSLYYNDRLSNVDLRGPGSARLIPDFPLLAEALGCVGLACDRPEDVDTVLERAMEIDHAPVVVDFRVQPDALVWPSIADGASNDAIQLARGMAPSFETSDL
ncbi:acetolactate synthase large subunit [Nocardioides sp. AN3]